MVHMSNKHFIISGPFSAPHSTVFYRVERVRARHNTPKAVVRLLKVKSSCIPSGFRARRRAAAGYVSPIAGDYARA